MSREFDLIRRYFSGWPSEHEGIILGVGDDCAQIQIPAGYQMSVSIDTMVEGIHFLAGTPAELVGYRALAVAISDLAAMGAKPVAFTSALTIPEYNEPWLQGFAEGLETAARSFGIALVGGDTTRGPLTITIQVMGQVLPDQVLTRGGAQVGDLICITGTLGMAGVGLAEAKKLALSDCSLSACLANPASSIAKYFTPQPRLAMGRLLSGKASSCIDLSDGLFGDLGHILKSSAVGASLVVNDIPVSSQVKQFAGSDWLNLAGTAGDDYELCFTICQDSWQVLKDDPHFSVNVPVSVIGKIVAEPGITLVQDEGSVEVLESKAYTHF